MADTVKGYSGIVQDEDVNIPVPNSTSSTQSGGEEPTPKETVFQTYKMGTNPKNRKAIIVNNQKFSPESKLIGRSDTDVTHVKEMLKSLNFLDEYVRIEPDLTCVQMTKLFEAESKRMDKDVDCFICVILTYGAEGLVYGHEGVEDVLPVDKIMEHFKGNNCESLRDKPKLFFIQACHPNYERSGTKPENDGQKKGGNKIPVEADLLLVHSSLQDKQCGNDPPIKDESSIFVAALAETIMAHRDEDLLSALTHMNRQIASKYKNDQVSLPYISSTLRREVYF